MNHIAKQAFYQGGLSSRHERLVREYVDAHLGDNFSILDLSKVTGFTRNHFTRVFKQTFGITPQKYRLTRRFEQAKRMICDAKTPLSRIALETGFADQSHFCRAFKEFSGSTPTSWLKPSP